MREGDWPYVIKSASLWSRDLNLSLPGYTLAFNYEEYEVYLTLTANWIFPICEKMTLFFLEKKTEKKTRKKHTEAFSWALIILT